MDNNDKMKILCYIFAKKNDSSLRDSLELACSLSYVDEFKWCLFNYNKLSCLVLS